MLTPKRADNAVQHSQGRTKLVVLDLRQEALGTAHFVGKLAQAAAPIWGPAATNSVMLAVSEINRRGGILGREIELSMYDAGGPIGEVARRAAQAIAIDEVDVVMGSHISAVRVALRKVTGGRVPYIYTPVYEGGERTPGVMAIGETSHWQSRPAIDWLSTGGAVVGEEFVPLGEDNHEAHLERIRAAMPDVVLISLIGTDSITFNRAFGECGLAATTLRLAGAMDVTVLLGIGADNTEKLFCASGYFSCLGSRANDEFRSQYQSMFGTNAPPLSASPITRACGFWKPPRSAQARWRSGRCSLRHATSSTPARGLVTIRDGRAEMQIYLTEADGLDFKLVKML